ncbi:MAG: metal-dependent hydrolase [Egibacteraceae bacterium]
MMGRSHALSGAAGWLALAPPLAAATDIPMEPAGLAAGAVVTAGAALLPDLDHPSSTVARALGPVSQLLAVAIATLAGGHRQATHSLVFVAAVAAGVWAGMLSPAKDVVALATGGLCVGLAIRALGPQQLRGGGVIDLTLVAWTVALTGIGWVHLGPVPWLPAAVALGAALHLAGDCLTPQGCPLLWPHPARCAWPVLSRTGGPAEALITGGLALAVAYLAYAVLVPSLPLALT